MSVEKCQSCGAVISTLATNCQVCGAPISTSPVEGLFVPRYLKAVPLVLTILMGSAAIKTVSASVSEYRSTVASTRLSEARAAAAEETRIHAEELKTSRRLRDSILRKIPPNRIRRLSAADLAAGLAIVSAVSADTTGHHWSSVAARELARRASLDSETTARAARRTARALNRERQSSVSTAPSGASAQCRDGTYSFSSSHRGACSHHGGVATWL
jgi:hypothetical protein